MLQRECLVCLDSVLILPLRQGCCCDHRVEAIPASTSKSCSPQDVAHDSRLPRCQSGPWAGCYEPGWAAGSRRGASAMPSRNLSTRVVLRQPASCLRKGVESMWLLRDIDLTAVMNGYSNGGGKDASKPTVQRKATGRHDVWDGRKKSLLFAIEVEYCIAAADCSISGSHGWSCRMHRTPPGRMA